MYIHVHIYRSPCIYRDHPVCVSIYICDYIQIILYINRTFCVYTCAYIQITLYIQRSSCVCVCIYIYICDYIQITLYMYKSPCIYTCEYTNHSVYIQIYIYIQGVTGGTDQTSGECSLGQTIPI